MAHAGAAAPPADVHGLRHALPGSKGEASISCPTIGNLLLVLGAPILGRGSARPSP